MILRRDFRTPSRLDNRGRILFGDDGRPFNVLAERQRLARKDRCLVPLVRGCQRGVSDRFCRVARVRCRLRSGHFGRADCLTTHRFRDQAATFHQKTEALPVGCVEFVTHFFQRREVHDQRGISAVVTQMHAPFDADVHRFHSLCRYVRACRDGKCLEFARECFNGARVKRQLNRLFSHCGDVCQSHAIGRQHARQRMNVYT